MVIVNKTNIFDYAVYFNTKYLGTFKLQPEGGYLFFEESPGGWSEYGLMKVAEKLKEVNKEFYESMTKI